MLTSPVSYQGGKHRIAAAIIDIIQPSQDKSFYDLCCGSGAISIELINRGFDPRNITMLDKGPWGLFWQAVGDGKFDISYMAKLLDNMPKDKSDYRDYVKGLSNKSPDIDTVYIFLILQACSFGAKSIWIENNRWMNCSFRSYWLPTAVSNRRSPVNPMMPMPDTLLTRLGNIVEKMKGVKGCCDDIFNLIPTNGLVYVDPPYQTTTQYGNSFDIMDYVKSIKAPCYVSEGKALSANAVCISKGRSKGGISGNRKIKHNEEWLTKFN